jgi:hypothetical protein
VEEELDKKASLDVSHLKLLYKSLGISWKSNGGTKTGNQSEESGAKERTSPPNAGEEANLNPALSPFSNGDGSDAEDMGLHVGMDRTNTVVAAQAERVDHNLEIMMRTKTALTKAKNARKHKLDKVEGVKEGKAAKKKKKKKDFFDDLFGG